MPPARPRKKSHPLDITTDGASITKQLAAIGLTTASPETVSLTPEVKGYGRVLDPTPLVVALAEIESARATLSASEKDYARVAKLHAENANATAQAVEAAEAAQRRDRVTLASAQTRLIASWGKALPQHGNFATLVGSLASGDAALVRIDLLPGDQPALSPATARVGPLTKDGVMQEVELLGPAPSADPQLQGLSFLALWPTAQLPPGAVLRAALASPGEARAALLLPRGAFVRHEGGVFVYVQTEQGGFERRLVTLGPASDKGIVVATGVEEKDKVVVAGAQQLLATEILGSTGGEEP